jgi:hypothetical protein
VEIESSNGLLRITFRDDVTACDDAIARIKEDAPRAVHVICDHSWPGEAWTDAIAGNALPSVKAFVFDTYFQTQTRQRDNEIGDLAVTFAAFPSLEHVFATGALAMSQTGHDKLRALHLLGDPLTPRLLAALGKSNFPALDRLVLGLASDAGPGPTEAALVAIRSLHARAITIDGGGSIEEMIELIGQLPPCELVLRGAIDDEDALVEAIETNAAALKRLTSLALPFADYTSSDAIENARKHVPRIKDSETEDPGVLPATYQTW